LDSSIANIGKGCQSGNLVLKLKCCREGIKKDYCSFSGEVEDAKGLHIILRCVHTLNQTGDLSRNKMLLKKFVTCNNIYLLHNLGD
jgi:hypothetical protein